MKTIKILLLGAGLFFTTAICAQVNVNVGTPPLWGPTGYPATQYYYLPDVESYYDIPNSKFIYYSGGNWVHRSYLPTQYRNYNLYNGYKVVMSDYRGNAPYINHTVYKVKYAKGYRGPVQKNFGVKPGRGNSKFYKGHPVKMQGHGRGNGKKK